METIFKTKVSNGFFLPDYFFDINQTKLPGTIKNACLMN